MRDVAVCFACFDDVALDFRKLCMISLFLPLSDNNRAIFCGAQLSWKDVSSDNGITELTIANPCMFREKDRTHSFMVRTLTKILMTNQSGAFVRIGDNGTGVHLSLHFALCNLVMELQGCDYGISLDIGSVVCLMAEVDLTRGTGNIGSGKEVEALLWRSEKSMHACQNADISDVLMRSSPFESSSDETQSCLATPTPLKHCSHLAKQKPLWDGKVGLGIGAC